jgi:hypothetical protein
MTLRADHVAGAAFILFGAAIIALSGDLPVGRLSMPGSGFLPMIVAVLTMIFGLALIARASAESAPFSELEWEDGKHAVAVTLITAAAIVLYTYLGFIITMVAMMVGTTIASMITAWVAFSPKVTGSRIEMPERGPMPGSTPTSVPTRQPRKAYQRLSGWNAMAKPCARLSSVLSTRMNPRS